MNWKDNVLATVDDDIPFCSFECQHHKRSTTIYGWCDLRKERVPVSAVGYEESLLGPSHGEVKCRLPQQRAQVRGKAPCQPLGFGFLGQLTHRTDGKRQIKRRDARQLRFSIQVQAELLIEEPCIDLLEAVPSKLGEGRIAKQGSGSQQTPHFGQRVAQLHT